MPTYVYRCEQCETTFEAVRKYSDPPLELCPAGHEGVARVFTPPVGIHFKGSGWYSTDSKGSTGGTAPKSKESAPKSESSESSAPKSESAESPKADSSAKSEAA